MNELPPLCDYREMACRFTETLRQNQWNVAEGIRRSWENYARGVREECAQEAGRWGANGNLIRERTALATQIGVAYSIDAEREFGLYRLYSETQVEDFVGTMFRELAIAQITDAVRESGFQADSMDERDDAAAMTWRHVEANLRAKLAAAESETPKA